MRGFRINSGKNRRNVSTTSLLAVAVCHLLATTAIAGEEAMATTGNSTINIGEVVVKAERGTSGKTVPESPTTGSFTLAVSSGDRARTSDTSALLADTPGASLQQNGGVSTLPFLNGMGDDRLRIKVDGMDLISACPNHMNSPLSYIDPSNVATIQVVAGITPVSMGGDSIGGSIVVNSAAPKFAKPGESLHEEGSVGAFYRSNGNARGVNLSATAATAGWSLRYAGSYAKSGNYTTAKDFKPSGPAAIDQGWLNGDEVGSSKYEASNHNVVLGWQKDANLVRLDLGLQKIPYEGFPNQRMDMTDNTSEKANLSYSGQFAWGTLEARTYYELTQHEMDFGDNKQFLYGSAATILAPGMPMDTKGKNGGLQLKGEMQLSDRDLLRLGFEGQRYRLDDWWPPSPGVLPPGVAVGGMAPDTFLSISGGRRDRLALYTEWEAEWSPRWLSQIGLRGESVTMDTGMIHGYNNTMMYNGGPGFPADTFNGRDHKRTDTNFDLTTLARFTPKATETYEFGYARKTRSPNLYERYAWSINTMAMEMINFNGDGNYYVGNLDLKPETANTVSATADWHGQGDRGWSLQVTPYYTKVDDYINVRRCPTSVCGQGATYVNNLTASQGFVYLQFANEDAHIYGIDVSGQLPLASTATYGDFSLRGLVNYAKGESEDSHDNLYNIMPLNGKLALSQHLGPLTSTVEGQFVAAKNQVSWIRNEVRTAGYALMNLKCSYEWKNLRLDGGVDNLFDRQYEQPLGGAYVGQGPTMSGKAIPWGVAMPGPGRSLYAAVSASF